MATLTRSQETQALPRRYPHAFLVFVAAVCRAANEAGSGLGA